MRTESVTGLSSSGLHRMVYHEWGSKDNERVLVCVHGLARNSRDFDEIAKTLSREYRVICPDIVGRGESDWLLNAADYGMPQYLSDITVLLARLNVEKVDWLGTSMGGIIGMLLAAMPKSPIRKLILNDIGAFVSQEALGRIGEYLVPKYYDTLDEAQVFMQTTYIGLRNLTEDQWKNLTKHGFRQEPQGWTQHYDPAIGDVTRATSTQDVDLWPVWRAIQCPQMLIWGEDSDVLNRATVEQMQQENAAMSLYSLPGIPHVPSLMEDAHIQEITQWLRDN
ncbi:alpha/beta hydrolase [Neptunomonas sp.]|uniref:alpha/beta fold hydrolase n=1 Tax=Neptunomonas sp. TaxID=1971898 RepID=UPI0025FE547C|nr:alpha/beta hydrolase [Neptunomonas sp.]